MLKNLFSNRLLIGALAIFVLMVVSGMLYMQHVEKQSARELAETQKRINELTEKPPTTAEAPVGDTSQGGHFHADGTFHTDPHAEVEPPTEIAQYPAAPDLSKLPQVPDDIDPDNIPPFSVSSGDGTTYHYDRPLTPEERNRYDFLKSLPDYKGVSPAKLKIEAIAYVRHEQIRAGAFEQFSSDLRAEVVSGRITEEEARKRKEVFTDAFFERTR